MGGEDDGGARGHQPDKLYVESAEHHGGSIGADEFEGLVEDVELAWAESRYAFGDAINVI